MMRIVSKTSLCSSIALATALVAGARPAAAQVAGALNNAGGATISGGGASVVLNAPQTTIDWTATGAPISGVRDFLPSGNTMAFSGSSDFAVLNRVASGGDMIGLNGTITSTVGRATGGTVFFYNPNGIVVGGGASIDVGSLGLTTSDPGTGNNWFADFGGNAPTLTFGGVTNAASQIEIKPNATIKSNGTDSFIAMVAPKITTAGKIMTDGDVALVAAEAATLSFSGAYDLYSIEVDVGTGVADSLNVTGGSIERNSQVETSGVARRGYLVTVPKNDATTLLISGGASLGFDVANSAVVEGNSIVLSAGRDTAFVGGEAAGGTIKIEQSSFHSDVDSYATNRIDIAPTSGTTHFFGDAEFTANNVISVDASAGDVLFDGTLYADVSHFGDLGMAATGGNISLRAANGHGLTVTGETDLRADGSGGYNFDEGVDGAAGTGGQVEVLADSGQVHLGNLYATADGRGGVTNYLATGGVGQGGTIETAAANGGAIDAGYVSLSASGEGGSTVECSVCSITGGAGKGGTVAIRASGTDSAIHYASLFAGASGSGGAGDAAAGIGTGGSAYLDLAGLSSADLGDSAYLTAYGSGGYGLEDAFGGDGTGGLVQLTMNAAGANRPTLHAGYLSLDAAGTGYNSGNGNEGGVGTGGIARAIITGGDITADYLSLSATGRGGYSWNAQSGDSNGGTAAMTLNAATAAVQGYLRIDAGAQQPSSEGALAIGNVSTGGTASLIATGSSISTNLGGETIGDSLWVGANAAAGGGSIGIGGSATGGSVIGQLGGSTIMAGDIVFDAHADGGYSDGGIGGNAKGGSIDLSMTNTDVSGNALSVDTHGMGAGSAFGGGEGRGGSVRLVADGTTIDLADLLGVDAYGQGGSGGNDGAHGGDGYGGTSDIALTNTSLHASEINLNAQGLGGNVNYGAAGGNGQGGNATFALLGNSQVSTGDFAILAYGQGGAGNGECSECSTGGGDGSGGESELILSGAGNSLIARGPLLLDASGFGGYGELGGGGGAAGTARLFGGGAGGSAITLTNASYLNVTAEGHGGDAQSGAGGAGKGGNASYVADGLALDGVTGLYVSGLAMGGNSIGGAGGAATAGDTQVRLTNGASASLTTALIVRSSAVGGSGTIGGSATAGSIDVLADNSRLISGTSYSTDDAGIILDGTATGGEGSDGNGGDALASGAALRAINGGSIASTSGQIDSGAQGGNSVGGVRAANADAGASRIEAVNGGNIALSGAAMVQANAVGGAGSNGADGGNASADAFAEVRALGGTIGIAGDLDLSVDRTGGDGLNGGDALAIINYQTPTVGSTYPVAEILAQNGSVTVGGMTTLTADAVGGSGSLGGRGGDAFGGAVSLRALNGALRPGAIDLGDLAMSATATAGDGRRGIDSQAANGGDGGAGGDALGGLVFIQAMALNGQISAGNLTLATDAIAGTGGDGGFGINGGDGGQGGSVATNWSAGAINIAVPSGANPPGLPLVTDGFVHLGDISASTTALGGDGGWAGFAFNGTNGFAGNGGYAQSGDVYIINRGGDLAAGTLDWNFDATGGAAGANANESAAGVGGSASTGELILLNTNRVDQPDQRGTMSFGDINALGTSTGGFGLVSGSSLYTSAIDFETINADTHLGSLTYRANASDGPAVGGYDLTSLIAVQNGSVRIDGGLDVLVPDAMAVWLDNGTLTADSITITAGDFIQRQAPAPAPGVFGTLRAGSISLTSGHDIIVDADLDVTGGDLDLAAAGSVAIGSAAATGNVSISADGGFILSNDLYAAGDIVLAAAGGDLVVGALTSSYGLIDALAAQNLSLAGADSGSDLYLTAVAGDLLIAGNSTALGGMELDAGGRVQAGDLTAQGTISVVGEGGINVGDVFAGADLGGGIGSFALNPGADIGLWSSSTIDAGDLFATARIGLAAPGTITTGSIEAGDLIMLLGGADILTGPITAGGELYIGNYAMFGLGYDPQAEDFDPAPVLALAPQATGGNVTVGGNVSATQVRATAGGNWSSGAITASDGPVTIGAGGGLTAGAVTAPDTIALSANGGSLSTGTLVSGGQVLVNASGDAAIGGASGSLIAIASGGATSASGALNSGSTLQVNAGGNVQVQSASAATSFTVGGSNVQIGALSAPTGSIAATGLLGVGGAWNVGSLFARSNDIAIAPNGGINGNQLVLLSTNAIGAGIGDNSGAANGSYILDDGELARIGSPDLVFRARENASPIDLKIGTTTLVGGGRSYDFGVIDTANNDAGRLRVTGEVTGQNFGANDYLDLDARLMEVDAVNGGIDFSPNSNATVGTLSFAGERVHVAEGAVLDRLAADPNYANRDVELATAPTAAHNAATINVGTVNVDLFQTGAQAASPYTVYVQNMGSTAVRSGLLIADAELTTDKGAGSVEMILNGVLVDPATGQLLTGVAARDAFVADKENDLTLYTAASSINGCALTAATCAAPPPPPPPPPPGDDLANQIVFLTTTIGDMLVFGEDSALYDDDGDKIDDKNAIESPPTLIDGRALDPQSPTDEPVSGTGNPALIGTGSSQQEQK